METDADLFVIHVHVGRHIDQVAKDLASLRAGIAAHSVSGEAIQTAGQDQQCHVEIHFEPNSGGQRW